MDSIRFDTLTKALTSRGGRRTVLRRIAGGAGVALAAAAEPRAGRAARGRCPTGQRRCPGSRGACVDLQTDPKHCRRCGNDCSSCLLVRGRVLRRCLRPLLRCGADLLSRQLPRQSLHRSREPRGLWRRQPGPCLRGRRDLLRRQWRLLRRWGLLRRIPAGLGVRGRRQRHSEFRLWPAPASVAEG
jgi:hypothetical protein